MMKMNPFTLSTNDNKLTQSHLSEINEKILIPDNFPKDFLLKEMDLKYFYLILKLADNHILPMIKFMVKKKTKKYKKKEMNKKENIRIFIIKQLILLFQYIYLEKPQPHNQSQFAKLYSDLYNLIFKFHTSFKVIQITDVIEILRYNIIISMNDLINKYYIFNKSINFLTDTYKIIIIHKLCDENEMKALTVSLTKLFDTIYQKLLLNHKNLQFLQRYDDIDSLALFNIISIFRKYDNDGNSLSKDEDRTKLNNIINELIYLVYCFNYGSLINEELLDDIKEGFFELKKGNEETIKNLINIYNSKIHLLNNLYLSEKEEFEKDIYFPKNYFVFYDSPSSGIDYNPEFPLFKYNFLLLFTFRVTDETKNYPLITFLTGENDKDKNEILLNISIQNQKLSVLFQNDHQDRGNNDIQNIKSYFTIIKYLKNSSGMKKLNLIVNDKEERKSMK